MFILSSLRLKIRSAQIARKAVVGALSLGLVLTPVAHAVQVQIKKDLKMWIQDGGYLKRVGLLTAGSTVEIPNQFRVNDRDGQVNIELTLNNWLQKAGYDMGPASNPFANDGERSGHFFPVRVVRASPGSEVEGLSAVKGYYMPIGALARDGDALVVTEDAPLYPWNEIDNPLITADRVRTPDVPAVSDGSDFEARSNCPPGGCLPRSQTPSFNQLVSSLQGALDQTAAFERRLYSVNEDNMSGIRRNFRNHCGIALESFMGEVKRQASEAGIPPETLLSLMVRESGGNCQLSRGENNGTTSVGLFQVGSHSAKYPRCSASQKRTMKAMSIAALQYSPQCLENPVYNLKEAIRMLQSKLNVLTQMRTRSGSEQYTGFDPNKLKANGKWTREAWRLAISAFNGGERWVLRAKRDLELFNSRFGTRLDPHNWEDLRVFYLRRHLDRNKDDQFFGNKLNGRKAEYSRLNLAYTENIVPRDERFRRDGKMTMPDVWAAALRDL